MSVYAEYKYASNDEARAEARFCMMREARKQTYLDNKYHFVETDNEYEPDIDDEEGDDEDGEG